jgi:ankyrin repeat protein
MKSIAFECDREFILRDDHGPRLITTSDLLLFHENGLFEVASKENLKQSYALDFSYDPQIRIYQKTAPLFVSKMSAPFLVKQNSYYCRGEAGDYLVQDLIPPHAQYVFNESDYIKYIRSMTTEIEIEEPAAHGAEEDGGEDEHGEEEDLEVVEPELENHLEEKYSNTAVRSAFFTKKFWTMRSDIRPSAISIEGKDDESEVDESDMRKLRLGADDFDIQSVASGEYIEPTLLPEPITLAEAGAEEASHHPIGLPLTWNLKHGKYLGMEIRSSSFSIEFQDKPLAPQSERFRGRKGDFLLLNCGGYLFGILSPIDFYRLCESHPLGYLPNSLNDHSSVHVIHSFSAKRILTKQVESVCAALWDGSIELGRVGDYLMQLDFPGNSSLNFTTRSVKLSSSGQLTVEDSMISNDLYQWITSAADLEEFFSAFPHNTPPPGPPIKKPTPSETRRPSYSAELSVSSATTTTSPKTNTESKVDQLPLPVVFITPNSWVDQVDTPQRELFLPSVLHCYSPFDVFSKDTFCWYGKLDRYLRKKQVWKSANFIVYRDRICLIPLDSKKRKKSAEGVKRMKYFLFSECTDISTGSLNYRDCIQLHGMGAKLAQERKSIKSVLKSIPALFTAAAREDTEYFAIRQQSRSPSLRELSSIVERDNFVNMNAIRHSELLELFTQCSVWTKRQMLYQLTYELFEREEQGTVATTRTSLTQKKSSPLPAPSVDLQAMIQFFEDPKLTLGHVEQILTTPVDESQGMLYLHKLASYPYDASVEIADFILKRFYHELPSISPLRLCCQHQVDALHIAIRCNNETFIKYLLSEGTPCAHEFVVAEYFQELSIHSYICCATNPTIFKLVSSYVPRNLFASLDSQENTLVMLLLARGATSVALHVLETIPFGQILESEENLRTYFNLQNWKHQSALSLALSLFHFYSNTLTDSLCNDIQRLLELLLEKGSDPNLADLEGNTALHMVCSLFLTLVNSSHRMIGFQTKMKTYIQIMKLLLHYHCDLFALNHKGETGLSIIAQIADYSIPKEQLVDVVDTLIGVPPGSGQTQGFRVRSYSGSEMGDQLAKQLSLVNHSFGARALSFHITHSPLHSCAYNGHALLLTHLINRGGDIHRQNHLGEKPIDIIIKRQQTTQSLPPSPSLSLLQHGLDECLTVLIEQRGNVKYHLERKKSSYNLKSHVTHEIIYSRHREGHYEIKSGVITALIPLLCHDKYCANEDDIRAVALSYHLVSCSHVDLLRLVVCVLKERIRKSQEAATETEEGENEEEELELRGVLSFLFVWFSWRRNELGTSSPFP